MAQRNITTTFLIIVVVFVLISLFFIKRPEMKTEITGMAVSSPTPTATATPSPSVSPVAPFCVGITQKEIDVLRRDICEDATGSISDYCESSNAIHEVYCDNNICKENPVRYCSEGLVCNSKYGICMAPTPAPSPGVSPSPAASPTTFCVGITKKQTSISRRDICEDASSGRRDYCESDGNTLHELYCENDVCVKDYTKKCSDYGKVCSIKYGICVAPTPAPSPGASPLPTASPGASPYPSPVQRTCSITQKPYRAVKGSCNDENGRHEDYCKNEYENDNRLIEFFCSGGQGNCKIIEKDCSVWNEKCQDGRCLASVFPSASPSASPAPSAVPPKPSPNPGEVQEDFISGFVIYSDEYGGIGFLRPVNVSRIRKNINLIAENIIIEHKKIRIDMVALPELNVPAELFFKKIDFRNPRVLYNELECPPEICTYILYDKTAKTMLVNVSYFSGLSGFEVVEGPYCGDGTCRADLNESCSNCTEDCGGCRRDGGGSGGGERCISKWDCSWGPCVDDIQKQSCVDLNKCQIQTKKPTEESRFCFVKDECLDNDGDGYGTGKDCFGEDIDDNDQTVSITKKEPLGLEPSEEGGGVKVSIFPYLIGISSLILVILVVILLILSRKSKREGIGTIEPTKSEIKEVFGDVKWKEKKDIAKIAKAKEFISKMRKEGYSNDQIKQSFRKKGWKERDMAGLFV